MLARGFAAEVPTAGVPGDSGYGPASKVRWWLPAPRRPCVREGTSAHRVWDGGVPRRGDALAAELSAAAWRRLRVGPGSPGPRVYAWAWAWGRLPCDRAAGSGQWLRVRRAVSDPADLADYRVLAPDGTAGEAMARVAGTRWAIAVACAQAKGEVGRDQAAVRRWAAGYGHITLSLLAHACLVVVRAASRELSGAETGALTP
jgi:SRSO17 transposase